MEQKKLERINELVRKSKISPLTEEERFEQIILRREYIESYRRSLISQLENTYLVDEQGNKAKLQKRTD